MQSEGFQESRIVPIPARKRMALPMRSIFSSVEIEDVFCKISLPTCLVVVKNAGNNGWRACVDDQRLVEMDSL
jgi:hypothetical protein